MLTLESRCIPVMLGGVLILRTLPNRAVKNKRLQSSTSYNHQLQFMASNGLVANPKKSVFIYIVLIHKSISLKRINNIHTYIHTSGVFIGTIATDTTVDYQV